MTVLGKSSIIFVVVTCAFLFVTPFLFISVSSAQAPADAQTSMSAQILVANEPPISPRQLRLGLEIVADLSIDPPTYAGSCPAEFLLKGRITINKPITIYYRFIGTNMPPSLAKPLAFEKPETKEVSETRSLGSTNTPTLRATAVLQVVWPGKADSNVVDVMLNCTNAAKPEPIGAGGKAQPPGAFPVPQIGPGGPQPGSSRQPAGGSFPLPPLEPGGPQPERPQPGEPGLPGPGISVPQGPSIPVPSFGPDGK